MREHHRQSIERLVAYFQPDEAVVAVVLGGSVAKGLERADSDLDTIVVVTDGRYAQLERQQRLSECIVGHCTYEGGYFDVKYCTKDYLRALAERGSEPSRNAFLGCRCLLSRDPEVETLVARVPVFQQGEKAEKMLSFYSTFDLNAGYFWGASAGNPYLRARAAADMVLFGLRLLLQEREVLFPCHKALYQTVAALPGVPCDLLDKATALLGDLTDEAHDAFVTAVRTAVAYTPPADYSEVLTRFIDDNEQWWYKDRPVIAEW